MSFLPMKLHAMQNTIIENIKPTEKDAKTKNFIMIWFEAPVPRCLFTAIHVNKMENYVNFHTKVWHKK